MFELLLLIGVVYWIGENFGMDAESWALAILLIILICVFIGACRDGNRAYGNFVKYWRDGGPDGNDRERRDRW